MTCRNVRQLHDAFVDGELSASLTAEVHAHMLQCPACQREVEMLRACGSVIARDRSSEPVLDAGFADRVMAVLPNMRAARPAPRLSINDALETRRGRRRRLIRNVFSSTWPAAAAAMFFGAIIWPAQTNTRVLGVSVQKGVQHVVEPTLGAVSDARQSWRSLNTLCTIAASEAADGVSKQLEAAGSRKDAVPSFLEIFLPTFNEVLSPPKAGNAPSKPDADVVRF